MGGREGGQKIKLVFNVSIFRSIFITLWMPNLQNEDMMDN